jgi:hypothetical protein
MPFLSELKVSLADPGADKKWRIDAPLVYQSIEHDLRIVVPAGYLTDFASVPRAPFAFWLTGDTAHQAAVVHDYLCDTQSVDSGVAADIFVEAMKESGVPSWRRNIMGAMVRAFGPRFEAMTAPAGGA